MPVKVGSQTGPCHLRFPHLYLMREELEKKLIKEFPLTYRDHDKGPQVNMMSDGFAHGDGWFRIIWDLSGKIESEIKRLQAIGVTDLPLAMQCKEKFGTLRFYVENGTTQINKWINDAERKSSQTCETCGEAGSIHNKRWIKTMCDGCYARATTPISLE